MSVVTCRQVLVSEGTNVQGLKVQSSTPRYSHGHVHLHSRSTIPGSPGPPRAQELLQDLQLRFILDLICNLLSFRSVRSRCVILQPLRTLFKQVHLLKTLSDWNLLVANCLFVSELNIERRIIVRLSTTLEGLHPLPQRHSPELADVAEEKDECLACRLSLYGINSHCYDLVVSPLANVVGVFAEPSPALKDSKPEATAERARWVFLKFLRRLLCLPNTFVR